MLLLLCANLMVPREARADVVGGTLDAVGGSQPLASEDESRASETSSGDTSSGQTQESSQPAAAGSGASGDNTSTDGSASQALADPAGALGGTVESAGAVIADASPGVLEPTAGTLEEVAEPVGQAVAPALQPVGGVAEPVIGEVEPVLRPVVEAVEPVKEVADPILEPVTGVAEPVVDALLPNPDAPDGGTPQGPGDGTEQAPGIGTEHTPEGGPGEAVTVPPEPRPPAGAPLANDGGIVPDDYSGSVTSPLDRGSAPTRYGATANSSPVHDAASAVVVAGSGGSALAVKIDDRPQRPGLWFFQRDYEGLGTAVAVVAGGAAVSPGSPFSAIGDAIPRGASLESAGSAFATGLACCLLLLFSISRGKPTWASSRVAAPRLPLRLITERPD